MHVTLSNINDFAYICSSCGEHKKITLKIKVRIKTNKYER